MLAENFVMSLRSGSHGSEKALQATQGHWQAKRHTTRCLPRMTNYVVLISVRYKFRLMDRNACLSGNKRMPLFVLLYLMITLNVFLTDHLEAGLLERQATSCSAQLAGDNLAV